MTYFREGVENNLLAPCLASALGRGQYEITPVEDILNALLIEQHIVEIDGMEDPLDDTDASLRQVDE
jgi:hypothetical protein